MIHHSMQAGCKNVEHRISISSPKVLYLAVEWMVAISNCKSEYNFKDFQPEMIEPHRCG